MKSLAPSVQKTIKDQLDTLLDGGTEIITVEELEAKIATSLVENKPLRIKQGIDPTSPDVHIGHMVPYGKMRQFQDMGHLGVLIIGDFTAQIGDPTDRKAERTKLAHGETKRNAATYTRQIFKIVDEARTEVAWQSSWFSEFTLETFVELSSNFSVAHLLSHDTFKKRLAPGFRLSLHEMLYPVLQAWDSVQVRADVELGGTDQKFNILCGRDLMRTKGLEPQVALLVPLLPGADGRKMSKSFGNHIPVECSAGEKIGKIMSISDKYMRDFLILAARTPASEADKIIHSIESGESDPKGAKMQLAKSVARAYHPDEEVERAALEFDSIFSKGRIPDDIVTIKVDKEGIGVIPAIADNGLAGSTSEARRLIGQNAVSVEGTKIGDIYYRIVPPAGGSLVLKVGKRRYLRVQRR